MYILSPNNLAVRDRMLGLSVDTFPNTPLLFTPYQVDHLYNPNSINALTYDINGNGSLFVKGDGTTDDSPAINALITYAAANSKTIRFPAAVYRCNSQINLKSNTKVVCDPLAKFMKYFISTGSFGLISQSSVSSSSNKVNDIYWYCGTFSTPSNTVNTYSGNIFSLYGDDIRLDSVNIDTFGSPSSGGRGIVINGDRYRIYNPRIVNPNTNTGNGGIRVTGGTGGVTIGGYVEAGDDTFQFVPAVPGAAATTDTSIVNCAYLGCTGSSGSARLMIASIGNQTQEVNDGVHSIPSASITDCIFDGILGTGGARAALVLNTDSSGSVKGITFNQCVFGSSPDATLNGSIYVSGWICSGGVDGVSFNECTVRGPAKTGLYIDGSHNYSGANNPALDAQSVNYNCRNINWIGGRIEAPSDSSGFCIKLLGTKFVVVRDSYLIANGNDAVQVSSGSSSTAKCWNTLISGCTLVEIDNSQYGVNNQISDRTIIENCTMYSKSTATTAGAVRNAPISGSAGGLNAVVRNCDVSNIVGTILFVNPFNNGCSVENVRGYTPNTLVPVVLASSNTASSVSSGTAEVDLATVTIPAGILGTNGTLRVVTLWSYTNSANNKTLKVKLGTTAYFSSNATTTAEAQHETFIRNNNSASAQKGHVANTLSSGPYGASTGALVTSAINTAVDSTLTITGQPANAGETITLEGYTVEVIYSV